MGFAAANPSYNSRHKSASLIVERLRSGTSCALSSADIRRRPKLSTFDSRSQSANPSTTAFGLPRRVMIDGLPRIAWATIADKFALASFNSILRMAVQKRGITLHRYEESGRVRFRTAFSHQQQSELGLHRCAGGPLSTACRLAVGSWLVACFQLLRSARRRHQPSVAALST